MKNLLSLMVAGVLAMSAAVSDAQPPAPMPEPMAAAGGSVELFRCVKYVDRNEMAPCAKPMIVEVRDPCWKPDPCNPCSKPPCVKVQICVPECSCCPPVIKCSKDGKNVRYDFGKYAVDIRGKKGYIEVDYQD
ncbi:hypothetical protein LBMAG52_24860 [Planctomycetia bacterium]|nr:hypothetical protein LBMAG52_24860 [Planctomycetia bacterium]